jgi:hypothetical protein
MKVYGGVDVYIHVFLISARVGGAWLARRPGRFIPGERAPNAHFIGGWMHSKTGLDVMEK